MNDKVKIHLARMYEFITDALHICEDENYAAYNVGYRKCDCDGML